MKFIFWQNIISIHQVAFLTALSKHHEVILVSEQEIAQYRLESGWDIPHLSDIKIIVAPEKDYIRKLIEENLDSVHVFSGINAYKMVFTAFKGVTSRRLKTLIYAEPYNWMGFKGKLRQFKYSFLRLLYGFRINGILATGEIGCKCYKRSFFHTKRIFEWGYFTCLPPMKDFIKSNHKLCRVLFVGSLDERKNILELIRLAKKNKSNFHSLKIVGSGPLTDQVLKLTQNEGNIHYKGVLPNSQVNQLMRESDLLILPSLFDGWGAVVNEALQNGMRVLCSENCGAGVLLDNIQRGGTFRFDKTNDFENKLNNWINKGPLSIEERIQIVEWSEKSISGTIAAEYFLQICNHVFNKGERPVPPWKINRK